MAIYKGTIAGIGDKYLGANIIKPEFDAKIYKFIIGKDCIIDGLNLNGNVLSAGMCVAQGYRGKLKSPITLDTTAYVYGVFKVNFDSNTPDEFYIETSDSEINQKDDILHSAGTYYLLLYKNGVAQLSRNYPANAVYADNTNHINDDGTLGKNVTAPTQPVNTSNKTPATTEFVRNQIKEEIGYDELVLGGSGDAFTPFILKRKAKMVVGKVYLIVSGSDYQAGQTIYTLPDGWKPKEKIKLGNYSYLGLTPYGRWTIYIDTNGKVYGEQTSDNTISTIINTKCFGYETN